MDDGFDLTAERSAPSVFLQWKGTDACFDFRCECGADCHFDGYFAHVVKCPHCAQEWEMPSILFPRKRCADTYEGHVAKVMEPDEDLIVATGAQSPKAP